MPTPITTYDPMMRMLHLIMALAMITLLGMGLYMSDLEPSPAKWQIYGIHKAIGMLVLAFVIFRIFWRSTHAVPAPLVSQKKWEIMLAKLVHVLLYAGMLLMPISGYVMSAAGGHAISIFGLMDVPLLIEKNEDLGKIAKEAHEIGGNLVIGAIALHFLGALKHHFIDKDKTLSRMFACGRCR